MASTHKIFTEKNEEIELLKQSVAKLNEEAAANFHRPEWRAEKAQQMTETIYKGFQHENIISLMSTVKNLNFNETEYIRETRGMKAFWFARGGVIEESTLRTAVTDIPRELVGFHVSEMEDKLEVNFAETAATLVELGIERMDAAINQRFLNLLQLGIPSSSPYYTSASGVSLGAVNSALAQVRDVTRNNEVVIVGRPTMVDQLVDELTADNAYSRFLPATNEDLLRRGVIGSYRGANIAYLTNFLDDNDESFFPANELYVLGTDAVRSYFFGGLKTKEWIEDDNWYWHFQARKEAGFVLLHPDHMRRIVDTSLQP